MSAEETIRALLRGTVDIVRRSLRDATAEALVEDYSDALRRVLRQAYEVGYREGLASAGRSEPASGASDDDPARLGGLMTVPSADEALATGGAETSPGEDGDLEPDTEVGGSPPDASPVDADDLESDEPQTSPDASGEPAAAALEWGRDEPSEIVVPRRRESPRDTGALRIFPHATVGTLLQRIHDYFGLERFDIDVVVCRKGDRARRQLKKSVRLAKYEVGE